MKSPNSTHEAHYRVIRVGRNQYDKQAYRYGSKQWQSQGVVPRTEAYSWKQSRIEEAKQHEAWEHRDILSPEEAALTKLGGGINSQAHQRAHSAGVSVEAKAASGEAARREFAGASDKELYGLHEKAHGLHKEAAATHPDRAMRSIHRDEARGHASAMGMLKAGIDKGEKVTLNRELAKGAVSEYIGKKVQEANKSKANEMSKAAHIVSGQAKEAGAGASKSSHKFAGETHLEAAKLQKVAGNPVAEARHLAKAGEHASNAGGAWDEAKHPRDKDGKFGG
jgi:hypothetical protein